MANSAGACHAWGCDTGIDSSCKSCVPQEEKSSSSSCGSCNNGYHVNDKMCMVFNCLRTPGTGCESCVDIPERVSDATCKTWPVSQELSTLLSKV